MKCIIDKLINFDVDIGLCRGKKRHLSNAEIQVMGEVMLKIRHHLLPIEDALNAAMREDILLFNRNTR
tara:strand:+ start:1025 stop:1228 length:204 start_codon:yes stop_codon:yes gene_type:complete